MNINQATVVGRAARKPELKALPSGVAVADLTIATSRKWKNQNGEPQEKTEWHNITLFGRTAEVAAQYIEKGQLVGIIGRLETQSWEDANGGARRYKTVIVAETLQLGPRAGEGRAEAKEDDFGPEDIGENLDEQAKPAPTTSQIEYPDEDIDPDDIPF